MIQLFPLQQRAMLLQLSGTKTVTMKLTKNSGEVI